MSMSKPWKMSSWQTWIGIVELLFFSYWRMSAKLVKGPFVKIVIFSPLPTDFDIFPQTSRAKGCLSSGWSVSLGAPNWTEFCAVYLNRDQARPNRVKFAWIKYRKTRSWKSYIPSWASWQAPRESIKSVWVKKSTTTVWNGFDVFAISNGRKGRIRLPNSKYFPKTHRYIISIHHVQYIIDCIDCSCICPSIPVYQNSLYINEC